MLSYLMIGGMVSNGVDEKGNEGIYLTNLGLATAQALVMLAVGGLRVKQETITDDVDVATQALVIEETLTQGYWALQALWGPVVT